MSSTDIQFIVQNLKSLLNFDLSLVSFSEKTSEQLLRLLVRTFSELSDIFAKQIRGHDDNLPSLAERCAQFLRSVKYQPSCDPQAFLDGLLQGDPDVVYPVFKWILHPSQRGTLGERAFVGLPERPPPSGGLVERLRLLGAQAADQGLAAGFC